MLIVVPLAALLIRVVPLAALLIRVVHVIVVHVVVVHWSHGHDRQPVLTERAASKQQERERKKQDLTQQHDKFINNLSTFTLNSWKHTQQHNKLIYFIFYFNFF